MQQADITLYSFVTSPYAMKVHCYLLYKSLRFNVRYLSPIDFAKQLPIGSQIPVLTVDEESKADSSHIGIWLDSLFPDIAPLLPKDSEQKDAVLEIDQWVTNEIIPVVFYSVHPRCSLSVLQQSFSALRLGRCVAETTEKKLPRGLRFFWPWFIHRAQFIKELTEPFAQQGSVSDCRARMLESLDEKLSNVLYLADTKKPSLADLSAWPMIAATYQLGIVGASDFLSYPNIVDWVKRIHRELCIRGKNLPPLIPQYLVRHSIGDGLGTE